MALAIITIKVYGDIIVIRYSAKRICVKIENLNEYPDIVIVGVSRSFALFSKPRTNIIDSNSCLNVHKASPLTLYAVKKNYLDEKGINNIKWKRDNNVRKSDITVNANTVDADYADFVTLDINYIILGFNKNSMIMFKTSQTNKFNNDKDDIVELPWFLEDENMLESYIESLKRQRNLQKNF